MAEPHAATGEEVTLHMYDLSHGMAASMSQQLLGTHVEAVWHTAVVVFGREFYFGGGVQQGLPGRTQYGRPFRTLALGRTHVPRDALEEYLAGLRRTRFGDSTYNILTNNCNNFSAVLCEFLLGRPGCVPDYVMSLPSLVMASPLGAMLTPMLQPMAAALSVAESEPAPDLAAFAPPTASGASVVVAAPHASDAADEEAFTAAVQAEFERLSRGGMGADEAAELAVTHVLAQSGLA